MKKFRFLFVILFSILLINSLYLPVQASNKVVIENNQTKLELEITYAHYLDADGDGIQDDVIGQFTIDIETTRIIVYFGLEILLTLPSGIYFEYYYLTITSVAKMDFTIFLIDTATEPGWYELAITGILYRGDNVEGTAYYIFDPPGDSGGDPV